MEREALNDAMIHTSACDVLGVAYPIVQAGMARSNTGADLVAAVSAAGGLGVLGCLDRPPGEAVAEIRRIRVLRAACWPSASPSSPSSRATRRMRWPGRTQPAP